MKLDTRFFRAGIGTVVCNQKREVAFFKRAKPPVGIWQFQQGGIDVGESIETTLWREVKEEMGLEPEQIETILPYPHWTIYQEPHTVDDATVSRLGQAHRWFFLSLRPDATIDLTHATDDEFSEWKWVTFPEAVAATSSHKQHIYQSLFDFYTEKHPA